MGWGIVGLLITGGGLTALGALLGAWRESKREHARWLRNLRLKRYEQFITAANDVVVAVSLDVDTDVADFRLQAAQNVLALIGPEEVYSDAKAVVDYVNVVRKDDRQVAMDAYLNAVAEFNSRARRVLKIPHAEPYSIGHR